MKKNFIFNLFILLLNFLLVNSCFTRIDKDYNYSLIDSTGLYIYTHEKMSSPYGPTNKLFLFSRKLVKYVYFSETRCSEIFPLRYDRLKKKLKNKYPDFIKEIDQFSDHELIRPIDSLSKTPRVNIIFNKYKKSNKN